MNDIKDIDYLSNRSIVNIGDISRIAKAMYKVRKEKKLMIGFIGGSITEGAGATTYCKNYASLTVKWWKDKFPDVEIS